jgi:ABC-type cobalamin/Fe3+-siderophores transport system ATPase subunit
MEKLTLDDMLINNQVAFGVKSISHILGNVNAIKNSKNFEALPKHKQQQIIMIAHHLEDALDYSIEYFAMREDKEVKDK